MRKSFDGLCGLVISQLEEDPGNGSVYLFLNRRRDRIKLLVWDRTGFWILYKRLEQGRFQVPAPVGERREIRLPYEDIVMLLEGIDLASVRRRRRYRKNEKAVL